MFITLLTNKPGVNDEFVCNWHKAVALTVNWTWPQLLLLLVHWNSPASAAQMDARLQNWPIFTQN